MSPRSKKGAAPPSSLTSLARVIADGWRATVTSTEDAMRAIPWLGVDEVAIALPKGRETGMAYVRKYIEDAKSEGLIKAAVQRAALRGAADK